MLKFRTFEDVLDFAILQEKAAQQFYSKLSSEMKDAQVRLFYRTLVEEESLHERELCLLKKKSYALREPDLNMLRQSGYLDAMPSDPEMSLHEAVAFSLKKEKSARALYSMLAGCMKDREMENLFRMLSDQEQKHADYFQSQLDQESLVK